MTRARIHEAAHTLGYMPGVEKRGRPRTKGAYLIDLVMGRFHDPWTNEITTGARTAAARHGFDLVLTVERDDPDDDWPQRIRSRSSVGVVLGLIYPTSDQMSVLESARIPVVLLEPLTDVRPGLTSVGATDWQGGFDAAAHLLSCGLRSLVIVTDEPRFRFGRERVRGFTDAVERIDPTVDVVVLSYPWAERRAEPWLVQHLFRRHDTPIGVFALTHYIATSIYRAAHLAQKSIPTDACVVGFDDPPEARFAAPPLTTTHQPLREMATVAVDLVVEAAHGAGLPGSRIELPTSLIVRGSTAFRSGRTGDEPVGAGEDGEYRTPRSADPEPVSGDDRGRGVATSRSTARGARTEG
ncbi:substrate-binding domain-containing protein [Rathayibacter sp. VKM Ac-2803]|uniref:substrate-binding domain-containing protein n=1 Tax=Rathayibacter sp. VKM Ac-2803 TaxID=2609256 RepID=UPI001F45A306|nr:substrate-binding domain-containing protein [Rathayibacter sp. VKM Ac-2803]